MDFSEQVDKVTESIEDIINGKASNNPKQLSEEEQRKAAEKYSQATGQHIEFMNAQDMFDFECQRCGRCCMGRQDIIMSSLDIFHIAQATGETPREVVEKYTVFNIGPNSGLPILCLKTDDRNWCPFLKMDITEGGKFKCSIDRYKPGACRNHPIGIMMGFEKKDENAKMDETITYTENYVMVDQCENSRGHNHMNRVDDWVANTLSTHEEKKMSNLFSLGPSYTLDLPKFYAMILNMIMSLSVIGMNKFEELFANDVGDTPRTKQEIIQEVINLNRGDGTFTGTGIWYSDYVIDLLHMLMDVMYYDYDVSQDYVTQATANWKKLEVKLEETKKEFETVKSFMVDFLGMNEEFIYSQVEAQKALQMALSAGTMMKEHKEELENALES